jgi:catechol 2,3-dioxygenase-like lactoylglutathione lyase family enzyme
LWCGEANAEERTVSDAYQFSRDIIIRSDKFSAAIEFYTSVLGLPVSHRGLNIVGFETGPLELYVEKGRQHAPVFEVLVSDVATAKAKLLAAGCVVVEEDAGLPRCYVRDPYGMVFNIGLATDNELVSKDGTISKERTISTKGTLDPITLEALADFPERLEAYYSAVPHEYKNWRPSSWDGVPSEPFTPIEQVCHVRDIEIDGYHVRFRRTLEESNPLLPSLDGESLAAERSYATADTVAILAEFRHARSKTVALISDLTPQQLARAAEFEGHSVTLRGLVHNLCSHDQQHLAGMQWLLAKMAAP